MKKTFVVVMILLLLVSAAFAAKKDKDKEKAQAWLLDEAKLQTDEAALEYAMSLKSESIEWLKGSLQYMNAVDFPTLSVALDEAKTHSAWSLETALQALGMRQQLVTARAEKEATKGGSAGGDEAELGKMLEQKLAEMSETEAQLSGSQKDFFLASLVQLLSSISRETLIVKNIATYIDYAKSLKGLSATKEAKNIPIATAMAADLPVLVSNQINTLNTFLKIAKTNNIEIPEDVTAMLP